ncbi:type II secretion system protein F [Ruminiclostridium herbifermentans]|uniref:Type II secretion system protein F n=1 Tax=Ruminiclostridium herbifermentans TaxID=2488810 RepID=A0A4U7JGY1_9FIRM|nr:type II secretion system protein F [Ruminiclostridium herbifermentans]
MISYIFQLQDAILSNKLYLSMVLVGAFLILLGLYVSIYKKSFSKNKKQLRLANIHRYIKYIEFITNRFPLKVLSNKLSESISYFMLETVMQRGIVALLSIVLPFSGVLLYLLISGGLNLWYTRFFALSLCIMLPYYIFTLVVDYMKYNIRLKIPLLIDSFRSSFMMNYRIRPALQECGKRTNKALGRIILRASDSSDLNESLCTIRDKVNDTWFNIFVLLILNYRKNGGELIAQLYKLSRSITRYNNIEKKKNKRLIWYEVFVILTSIFSLPAIILLNKMLLGLSAWSYYDTTAAFTKVMIFSVMALVIVRTLRRM